MATFGEYLFFFKSAKTKKMTRVTYQIVQYRYYSIGVVTLVICFLSRVFWNPGFGRLCQAGFVRVDVGKCMKRRVIVDRIKLKKNIRGTPP